MLKNPSWEKPQDWKILNKEEKKIWNTTADNIEQFYRDMKVHKHINYGLNYRYMTEIERLSYSNFWKILEDQDKIYTSGNMLIKLISFNQSKKLVDRSQGLLNEKDLPYVYLSTFAFILIQIYESNINVLKKTLTTNYLTNKKGESVNKEIEEMAPANFLSMFRKYSKESVAHIENIILKHNKLRNALSHGLFWYENEQICWIDNVNSFEFHSIPFEEIKDIIREQSLFTQCFLWVGGNLIKEGFYGP